MRVVHGIHSTEIKAYPSTIAKKIYADLIGVRSEHTSIVRFVGESHFYYTCELASFEQAFWLSYPQEATTPTRSWTCWRRLSECNSGDHWQGFSCYDPPHPAFYMDVSHAVPFVVVSGTTYINCIITSDVHKRVGRKYSMDTVQTIWLIPVTTINEGCDGLWMIEGFDRLMVSTLTRFFDLHNSVKVMIRRKSHPTSRETNRKEYNWW